MEIENAIAVVTGAGRGIGRATALQLAREGGRVALMARTAAEIEALSGDVCAEGGAALAVPCDVADEGAVRGAFDEVRGRWGDPAIVVNNAGAFLKGPLEATRLEDWERVLRVNLTGAFLCAREALPAMRAAGAGEIINICSNAGVQGYPDQSAYCAAKHGMLGMARALAEEVRRDGVRVHSICPGGVETGFTGDAGMHFDGQVLIRPEDVAEMVVFLLRGAGRIDIPEVIMRRTSAR